jgi:quercetin dioxygenase-like cupin family protein
MEPRDIRTALSNAPELKIGANTTAAEADAAFPQLASFNSGGIFVGRFSGRSPWERHPTEDELLHVLQGEVEVTVLTDADTITVTVPAGSIFVVPRGLWHRQLPKPVVTLLSATPKPTEVSGAEDPRK